MNIVLISELLGLTAFVIQVATSKESPKAILSVWPPGSTVYAGESVFLQCKVEQRRGAATAPAWTYRWSRGQPRATLTPGRGRLVSGDSLSIMGVSREDGGPYWCQAETKRDNVTVLVQSELTVSELARSMLTVTPSSRQFYRGDRFAVQCPMSESNSSTGWVLKQLTKDFGLRTTDFQNGTCSPLEGAVSPETRETCVFTSVYSGNGGLYWCERAGVRSNAVNISVSYGSIILQSPVHAVSEGEAVVLSCVYWNKSRGETTFFRDGAELVTLTSHRSDKRTEMTIDNVTSAHQGFYKCASRDRKMESPESWLSVKSNSTSTDGSTDAAGDGVWKWASLTCFIVLLLLFITLSSWLVYRYRHQMSCPRSCCPATKEGAATAALPKTKQDVSEVQWDLSWMEMSNLLDKH